MKRLDQRGSHVLAIVLVIAVIGVAGFAGYRVMNANKTTSSNTPVTETTTASSKTAGWPMTEGVIWETTGEGGWLNISNDAPACPDPLVMNFPSDISKVTAVLYPGQTRQGTFEGQGGNYKPHGGLRFDKSGSKEIAVNSPFDGHVYRGSRFLIGGEIQYDFDIINPCGVMVRLGHLRELSPAFQAIADKFPAAKELDSRTEKVNPMVAVKAGDKIATAVGFQSTTNTFFDWGVYDLRAPNEASKSSSYQTAHADSKELAFYAVCWLDNVSASDEATLRALTAGDGVAGKTSDYCK